MSALPDKDTATPPVDKDLIVNLGLGMSIFSFLIFAVSSFWELNLRDDSLFGVFVTCYACTLVYWLVVMLERKNGKRVGLSNLNYNILLLILMNISAYALNRMIPVFHESVDWLAVYLMLLNGAMLGFVFRKDREPDLINHLLVAVISSGVLFQLYQTIYILPYYLVTVVTFWFFGISLHTLVPIFYVFVLIKIIRKYYHVSNGYQYAIAVGITLPALFSMGFAYRFHAVNQEFKAAYAKEKHFAEDLPAWVNASQHIPVGWMTERVLKTDVYYASADNFFNRGFNGMGRRFGVKLKHDPFIVASSAVSGRLKMQNDERLNLLRTMYNERHNTQERLWRGDNLSTKTIETNVKIYPGHRLAYTEKTLSINNDKRWGQQEAFYSFYLPEGSVVTSASLWIEGKEAEAILTTRAKADSAYQTIVGRERRDPLLVHWQEGNRVSARIFPCTAKEDRIFKLGVTSPLTYENNALKYQNIDFEGPEYKMAEETINLICDDWPADFDAALGFEKTETGYSYQGRYRSNWTFSCAAPPLSVEPFYFDGQQVAMQAFQPSTFAFEPERIYLDIHRNWSKQDVKSALKMTKGKKVYVFINNTPYELTPENKNRLTKQLRNDNYSLFPFYKIPKNENVLVITRDGRLTPQLDDLKKTPFYQKLSADFLERTAPIPVFHIGSDPSPYLKTLKEMRAFNFVEGQTDELKKCLDRHIFPTTGENGQTVVLNESKVQLVKTPASAPSTQTDSPDHLWRLYAYNNVMRQLGKDYFRKDQHHQTLIDEAEAAYVVSPISSLVTLETQADYDRFDIKKSNKTLGNANLKGGGAVPEPGEWLLIIFAVLVAMWLWLKG